MTSEQERITYAIMLTLVHDMAVFMTMPRGSMSSSSLVPIPLT